MSEKELWYGKPSFWNLNTSVIKLFITLAWCGLLIYLSRYIPSNNIPVPKIPLPEFISKMDGDNFYLLVFLILLITRRIFGIVRHFLVIYCTEIQLTEDYLNFRDGIFNKFKKGVELYRIKDLYLYEPLFYRVLGLQNINIISSDQTIRFPKLMGIPKSADLYELLKRHVEIARDKKGVQEIDYFNR